MARWEFKLPDIGEGISEGEIVSWLVSPGDVVTEDQPVVEVMTDKATVTITAPKAGTVLETCGRVGEVVPVHAVLVVFDVQSEDAPSARINGAGSVRPPPSGPIASEAVKEGTINPGRSGPLAEMAAVAQDAYFHEKPLATPATR